MKNTEEDREGNMNGELKGIYEAREREKRD